MVSSCAVTQPRWPFPRQQLPYVVVNTAFPPTPPYPDSYRPLAGDNQVRNDQPHPPYVLPYYDA
ncbi:MAG: hypothetical protein ACRDIB_16640 [Ardenticatenaceae bacterium]